MSKLEKYLLTKIAELTRLLDRLEEYQPRDMLGAASVKGRLKETKTTLRYIRSSRYKKENA